MCVAACSSAPAGGTTAADEPMPSPERDVGGQPRRGAAVDLSPESSPSSKKSEAAGGTAASSPVPNGVPCAGDECVDGAVGDECVKCRARLRDRQLDSWRRSMSRFGVDLRRLLIHIEKVGVKIDGDLLASLSWTLDDFAFWGFCKSIAGFFAWSPGKADMACPMQPDLDKIRVVAH